MELEFSRPILENSPISIFMTILPLQPASYSMQAGGRAASGRKDMTKLTVFCHNFANTPQDGNLKRRICGLFMVPVLLL
jgi:hypothetical protein